MVKSKQQMEKEAKALSISHPNSRKAVRLSKQIIKEAARKKIKLNHQIKRNLFGERLIWFRDNLEPQVASYTPDLLHKLFLKYLARFDDEVEQIQIKHSIGQRHGRQHASREDTIRMTIQRDTEEFNNAGLEIIDILNPKMLHGLRNWDGNLGRLSQFTLRRFSKKFFEAHTSKTSSKQKYEEQEKTMDLAEEDATQDQVTNKDEIPTT